MPARKASKARKGGKKKGGGYVSKAKKAAKKALPMLGKAAVLAGTAALSHRLGKRKGMARGYRAGQKDTADYYLDMLRTVNAQTRGQSQMGRGYAKKGRGYSDLHPYHAGAGRGGGALDDIASGFKTGASIMGSVLPFIL